MTRTDGTPSAPAPSHSTRCSYSSRRGRPRGRMPRSNERTHTVSVDTMLRARWK
jgi:hypothetical protein